MDVASSLQFVVENVLITLALIVSSVGVGGRNVRVFSGRFVVFCVLGLWLTFCVAAPGFWTYADANGRSQSHGDGHGRLLRNDPCRAAISQIFAEFQSAIRVRNDLGQVLTEFKGKLEKAVGNDSVCATYLQYLDKLKEVGQKEAEALECAEKAEMLASLLRGEPADDRDAVRPRIVAARFGDLVHYDRNRRRGGDSRFTCDATHFFWNRCHNTASDGVKVLLGPSYCIAHRDNNADPFASGLDLCGYDPAPDANADDTYEFRREKFIQVAYLCGEGADAKRKTVTVPAGSKTVPIFCKYPDRIAAPLKLDLTKGPCKVEIK